MRKRERHNALLQLLSLIHISREVRPKLARPTSPLRRVVENRAVPNPTRQARRAPVLSDLGDDDEDSLRLSAMFDEIGG